MGLGLVQLGLVGTRIDLEQQVVLLDFRSFLERHLHQVAGDPGNDVHRFDRVGPAGEVHEVGDLPLHGMSDRHGLHLRRGDLPHPFLTTGHAA